jgi:hypothetical protein
LFSDSFILLSFFSVLTDLLLVSFFRAEDFTTVVFVWTCGWFVPAFCPEWEFIIGLSVAVVVDLLFTTAPLSGCGFVTDLSVTVVVDRLFITVLLPDCVFVTGLLDIVEAGL